MQEETNNGRETLYNIPPSPAKRCAQDLYLSLKKLSITAEQEDKLLNTYFVQHAEESGKPLPEGFERDVRNAYESLKIGW